MSTSLHIHTAAELRARPEGWSFQRHYQAVNQATMDHLAAAQGICRKVELDGRDFLADEQRAYDASMDEVRRLEMLQKTLYESPDGREVDLSQVIETRGGHYEDPPGSPWGGAGHYSPARHVGGGHVYAQGDVRTSWVRDLKNLAANGDPGARDRLMRNNREYVTETRALSGDVIGSGSEFVPPLYLMNALVRVARPGRVFADQITGMPLPAQTDSLNVPRMVTGTAVGRQSPQNTQVENVDATSDTITSTIETVSGQQILSFQLVDQSPTQIDLIVLQDLSAALAVQIDQFALSANATGQVGILNLSGTHAVTYTDSAPTPGDLYPKIANAIQLISTSRFLPPTKIFVHPRRWAWLTAALDTTGRPLVVPVEQSPMNTLAAPGGVVEQGLVGTLQGLPVFTDPSIPTNLGTGTNQDVMIVTRADDLLLWESPVRAVADRISLASQLSMRLVLWNYVSVQHGRYPASTAIVGGTGLVAPTF
jgi:HK97 family phage major capsid protein